MNPYAHVEPREVRRLIREKKITTQTSGMCAGYAQANLVILPRDLVQLFFNYLYIYNDG